MKYRREWSSHLPILIKTLGKVQCPIVEVGTGLFSTPVLHWLCLDQKKNLFSYESVEKYYQMARVFERDWHKIYKVDNWDKAVFPKHIGLAFLDHEPAERRKVEAKRLADIAEYVVIHDTQPENDFEYGFIKEVFPLYKYHYQWKRGKPYTSVLSNFHDLKDL